MEQLARQRKELQKTQEPLTMSSSEGMEEI